MAVGRRAAILTGLGTQAERVLVRRLRERGAVSPETAVPLNEQDRRIHRAALRPLMQRRVVQTLGGTYWINEDAIALIVRNQRHGQRNALIALALFTLVICVALTLAVRFT